MCVVVEIVETCESTASISEEFFNVLLKQTVLLDLCRVRKVACESRFHTTNHRTPTKTRAPPPQYGAWLNSIDKTFL